MSGQLLIDIGNSRVKWAWAREGALGGHGAYAHDGTAVDTTLRSQLPPVVDEAVIVSVAQRPLAEALAEHLRSQHRARVVLASVRREFAGLTAGYATLANLGVDRWVAMLGAGRVVGYPCTVVDFGTAATVDAVDEHGQHLGGAIAPGRVLARRALNRETAGIRAGQGAPVPDSLFANDTGVAVAAGVDHGLAQLAIYAHGQLQAHLLARGSRAVATLVVTGGDAPNLMSLLPEHALCVDDLVLEGARVVLDAREDSP